MKPRIGALALLLLISGTTSVAAQETTVDSLALARQFTAWMYAGEADSLLAHSTEGALDGFSTRERWLQYADQISRMAGEEIAVLEETWKLRNGDCQYYRMAAFSDMEDFLLVRWIITQEGRIAGVGVGPAEQAPPFDSESCPGPDRPSASGDLPTRPYGAGTLRTG